MPSKTRRNILALLGGGIVIGSAGGAVAYAEPEQTPLVIVNNQMSDDQVVTVTIRTADTDELLVDETQTITAGEDQGYTDLVADRPPLVTIQTGDGLENTHRWTETAADNGLGIGITAEGIRFEAATPP